MDPIVPNAFESPDVLNLLFHPRPGLPVQEEEETTFDLFYAAGDGERLAMRFHLKEREAPTLLFFHGNGEVASDYEDIAGHYLACGFNFVIGEFRGYGLSHGTPGVSHLLDDARTGFLFLEAWLKSNGWTGPLAVMGRSLGSAPALEIAHAFPQRVGALIIESGFARFKELLFTLGLPRHMSLPKETHGPNNLGKMTHWRGPLLIIHATDDEIIPFSEGEDLFQASASEEKHFLKIEEAGHNDLFYIGFQAYLNALANMAQQLKQTR
ncbi:MAG: alpha/beta hydrolase [Desulfobacterales bacterium]|nr:alpha/beta hydrolase [Desulfobacterales bacterium]